MIDIVREIDAVQREVRAGRTAAGEGRQVRLERTYDAPIDDVWDALTNPERIGRWFLPVSGDYRLGGTYQFEGNAGGEIIECARPNRLKVTWAYGVISSPADVSEVELRLAPAGDQRTTLVLEHTAIVPEDRWDEYGPGAVGVGRVTRAVVLRQRVGRGHQERRAGQQHCARSRDGEDRQIARSPGRRHPRASRLSATRRASSSAAARLPYQICSKRRVRSSTAGWRLSVAGSIGRYSRGVLASSMRQTPCSSRRTSAAP